MHKTAQKWLAHLGASLGGLAVAMLLGFVISLIPKGGSGDLGGQFWILSAIGLLVQAAVLVVAHGLLFDKLSGLARRAGWFWARFVFVVIFAFVIGLVVYRGAATPLEALVLGYLTVFFCGGVLLVHRKKKAAL
ncbi:hypothetical protein shim_15590 [Shimia sp. SK013]|uniref:hypothetical protein n=1 Tax=Shimia sp. SK013 TaxID=1389006 RepID=UPI0006B5543D|nr:hypothetical protein [Shimia sp. SK013]KPA22112.1 hypothetical protein shim_15590 [Shimia sp. SK013]